MACPQNLIDLMADPAITFAAEIKTGTVTSDEKGIAPMMRMLLADENALEGGFVADRVIGKAAAYLLIIGKAAGLYTNLISQHAMDLLDAHGFPYTYDKAVPYIQNRRRDGMCPMEQTVLTIDDPATAFAALRDKWLAMQQK